MMSNKLSSSTDIRMHSKSDKTALRILMIAPTPYFADRGCHIRILGEAKALQQLGHRIKICTYHLGKDVEDIETIRILAIPWYKKLSAGPSIHKFYIDLLLLWKVLQLCRTFRPDVIHAHLHEGIVIGKIASLLYRRPLVADLQGSLTAELLDHNFIPLWKCALYFVKRIEKTINKMPNHLISSSTRTACIVIKNFGIEKKYITSIMDGVDFDIFYRRNIEKSLKNSLGIPYKNKVVVFIGVLTNYQGIDILLESIVHVVKVVKNVTFLIIGYPEEAYRKKAKDYGIEAYTVFTGKIPYAEAPRYLALGDIAISPKISATEANLKLFTYMAMGLPTVVFDNPVNREILGDLGLYARDGDMKALAQVLIHVLQNEQLCIDLGEASYQKALADYSWQAVGRSLEAIYRRFIRENPKSSAGSIHNQEE